MANTERRAAAVGRVLSSPAWLLLVALAVSAGVLPLVRTDAVVTPTGCAAVTAPRLSGAFIRPDVGPAPAQGAWWGPADWQGLLTVLRQDCLDQVVLQWTAQTWAGTAPPSGTVDPHWPGEPAPGCLVADAAGRFVQPLYATTDPVWAANAARPFSGACAAPTRRLTDQVGQLLVAARAAGVRVWLGLQIDEPPWFGTGNADATWMADQTLLSQRIAAQEWARYGPHGSAGDFTDTIAGFYLPFEADNEYFPAGSPQMLDYGDYLRSVSGYLHRLPGGATLGVMIAPVQHSQIGAPADDPRQQQLRQDWTSTLADWLSTSGVTVVAPQDATGMQTTSPADLGAWASAARSAIDRVPGGDNADGLPVQLWADAEIYSVQGVPDMAMSRLLGDLAATNSAGADVTTFVAFSVDNLDDTPNHPHALINTLYHAAYLRYLATGTLPAQRIDPLAALPGSAPPTRLAAVLTDTHGTTVGLRWRVASADSVHPDPAQPDSPILPVAGYQVFRDGQPISQLPQPFLGRLGPDGFPVPDTVTHAGTMGFSDSGLQPGRDYDYQVAAFDPFGNLSPLSNAVRVTVPLDAGAAAAGPGGSVDVAVHAPYAITDTAVDPATLTDGSADPAAIADHLVPPNGPGGNGVGTFPDTPSAPALNDGVVGTADYLDPAWSWQPTGPGTVTITTDLHALREVNTVRSLWLRQTAMGVAPPRAVTVDYASADTPTGGDWTRFGDTTPGGLPAGTPNPATPADTTFTDPGVGWLTTALPPGVTVPARWIRLTVTAPATAPWMLVSEVEVLGVADTADDAQPGVRRGPGSTATATGDANYTRPDAGCPGAAGCPTVVVSSATGATAADSGWMRSGLLTSGALSGDPVGRDVGWCFPESTACPTPPGGNPPTGQFAITLDLGSDQPIGSLDTTWSDQPDPVLGTVEQPAAVSYAYRTAADTTHPGTGWVTAGSVSGPTAGDTGFRADFRVPVPPDKTTGTPVVARWIKAVISLPGPPGWLLASAFHVYTPPVVTSTLGQRPLIYPTRSTINYDYDPGRPVDPDTNNPTTPEPDGAPPALPIDPSGQPIAAICSTTPGVLPCHATDPSPVLENVLTGLDPVTGMPYRGDPAAWWAADSHWLDLLGADGYDIVIPTPDASSALTELRSHFLQDNGAAIGLPATVDYYVTTTPNPAANPQADTWIWTRDTVGRPNLPPYLPDATVLTWTYTSTVPPTTAPVTAIRIHVNAYRGQHVFLDHAGAYAWAAY